MWIDYIKFEEQHSNEQEVLAVYMKAVSSLEKSIVDTFISQYKFTKTASMSQT